MIVSFLHVGADTTLAEIMCASVRQVMPEATLLHMTDSATQQIAGCERQELPYDGERLMTYRLQHLAVPDQPMVILDTDIIVQSDLLPVFERPFDVALTRRDGILMWGGRNIAAMMPYNTGVMFSKCPEFWRTAHEMCKAAPEEMQRWWGDQLCVYNTALTGRFEVLELPCDKFNYSPATEDEDVSDAHVVHYKGAGPRKQWMRNRGSRLLHQSEA